MKPKYEVLHSDTLTLAVELGGGEYYEFGTLTYTIQSDGRRVYIFDIDPERFPEALRLAESEMFPGFDPENGWYQRHDKEISFVYERTFHPKREDLAEMLEPWGMAAERYSRWELLKITKGLHLDKWRALPSAVVRD